MGRLTKHKAGVESISTPGLFFLNAKRLDKLKETNNKIILWLQRIGWVGFAFFLIKGLIWIAVWLGLASYFDWSF